MANNNDGSGKKDPKSGAKPAGGGQEARKPTALIDLKATEVKEDKPAAQATDKNKPSDKPAAAKEPAKPAAAETSKASATTSVPPLSQQKKPDQPEAGKAGEGASAKSDKKPDGDKAAGAATTAAARTPDPAATAPAKSSGGGVWSMFTHLAAGVAGGALVLFAAQPIEQETGIEFLPRAELPAEFGQRLAALESGSTAGAEIGKLSKRIDAAETQLAEIDTLRQQIARLASAPAPAPAATENTAAKAGAEGETDKATAALENRLAQLERTLETLSSTTGSDGERTNLARLAAVSGKVADIESSLNNQISALRDSVTKELEARVANTAEASAAATAGTKRLDRELATVKTGAARLEQRAATLKAAQDSLGEAVRVARQETAKLRVELDGLKADLVEQMKAVARPRDVATALAPLSGKVTAMETRLKDVVESEVQRKANAQRIVMALELGNLKRVLDRGGSYAAELSEVRRVTGGSVDLSALERFQATGVPTTAQLRDEFAKLSYNVIRASETKTDGTVFDRLVSGARSLVRVRRADLPASDNSAEATVARIDRQLQQGNLAGALEEAKKLSEDSAKPARPWLERVAARANVDRAISALENQLKSSLGSATGTKG